MIPKLFHFIWFGGLPSTDGWKNIIKAKQEQPDFVVRLYVASSILDQDTLHSIKEKCRQSEITLVDIDDSQSLCRTWFGRGLLGQLLKIGAAKNAKHMYACSSDLLRVMLMVYEGGFYFDVDCAHIPQIDEQMLNPKYGFLQLPYDYIRARDLFTVPPPIFVYAMQASRSFHPIYILALGNIVAKFKKEERLLACCAEAPCLIELASGQSVTIALQIAVAELTSINKYWFKNNSHDIFLPQDQGEAIKRGIGFDRTWVEPTQVYKRVGYDLELTNLYKKLKNEKYDLCYHEILDALPENLTRILGRNNTVEYTQPKDYLITPRNTTAEDSAPSSLMDRLHL